MITRKNNEAAVIKNYITGVVNRAKAIAEQAMALEVQPEHLISSVLEHLASAYVFNVMVSEQLNVLKAEMEALRRAIDNDKDVN